MIDKLTRRALAEARRRMALDGNDNPTQEEVIEYADDILADWERDAAQERLENGYDDCPTVANCDDAGTGEGRFHGRI